MANPLDVRLTRYIPHVPHPKQQAFLWLNHKEALFGGAAGGGKSDALLMAALQYADIPGYSAILFRKTFSDLKLPGALMSRAHEWLQRADARWIEQDKAWRFPSGATLAFGYLEHSQDKYRYQSAEFQFVGFDELTQFSEEDYTYLFSRLRKPAEGVLSQVPLRMRSASNPGGSGHDWVKQRFLEQRGERVFIAAGLPDNPSLNRAEYEASLSELNPYVRAQLLDGDWSAALPGSLFDREWFSTVDRPEDQCRWVRFWDLAATEPSESNKDPDWTVGLRLGQGESGLWYVSHIARDRKTPAGVEQLVKQTTESDGRQVKVFIEQEPGSSGKNTIDHYSRHVLPGYEVRPLRSTGSKEERAGPVSSKAEQGLVKLVRAPWNGAFLDEVEAFPGSGHDDQVDALSGAFTVLGRHRGPMQTGPDPFATPSPVSPSDRPIAQRLGKAHSDSKLHRRWAQRNFCAECAADYEELDLGLHL